MGDIADALLDGLTNSPCEWCGKWPEFCDGHDGHDSEGPE